MDSLGASELSAVVGLVIVATTLVRVLEQVIQRKLTGDRRTPDSTDHRILAIEAEASRTRDAVSGLYGRIDEIARSVARIEGRLDK